MEKTLYQQFKEYDYKIVRSELQKADNWIKNIFKLAWGKNGIEYHELFIREEIRLEKAIAAFRKQLSENYPIEKNNNEMVDSKEENIESNITVNNNEEDKRIDTTLDNEVKQIIVKKIIKRNLVEQQKIEIPNIKTKNTKNKWVGKSKIFIGSKNIWSLTEYLEVSEDVIEELLERLPIQTRQCIKFYYGIGIKRFDIEEIENILDLSEDEIISKIKNGIFSISNLLRLMRSNGMVHTDHGNLAKSYIKK